MKHLPTNLATARVYVWMKKTNVLANLKLAGLLNAEGVQALFNEVLSKALSGATKEERGLILMLLPRQEIHWQEIADAYNAESDEQLDI